MEKANILDKNKNPKILVAMSSDSEPRIKQWLNKNSYDPNHSLNRKNLRLPKWVSKNIQSEIEEEFIAKENSSLHEEEVFNTNQVYSLSEESESESESESDDSCCSFYEEILTGPAQVEYSETPSIALNNSFHSENSFQNVSLVESYGCSSSSGESGFEYQEKHCYRVFKDKGIMKYGVKVFETVIISDINEVLWESRSLFSRNRY